MSAAASKSPLPLADIEEQRKAKFEELEEQRKAKEKVRLAKEQAAKERSAEQQAQSMLSALQGLDPAQLAAKLLPLFEKLDKNQSGTIDMDELRKITQALKLSVNEAQLEAMMKEADTSGDGQIEFEEFVTVMKKQIADPSGAWAAVGGGGFFGALGGLFGGLFGGSTAIETKPAVTQAPTSPPSSNIQEEAAPTTPKGDGPNIARAKSAAVKAAAAKEAKVAARATKSIEKEQAASDEEKKLRAKLRPVFDAFDVDGSGTISTIEMGAMLQQLDIQKSPAELKALMSEADPDGSGEVDFEEFFVVLQAQMAEGSGGLLGAFSGAAGLLGILNPLSWFAPPPPPPPPPPPQPRSPVHAYGGGTWGYQEGSPTHEKLFGPTPHDENKLPTEALPTLTA